jgi:heterokaryon incompatibility protein (HET)
MFDRVRWLGESARTGKGPVAKQTPFRHLWTKIPYMQYYLCLGFRVCVYSFISRLGSVAEINKITLGSSSEFLGCFGSLLKLDIRYIWIDAYCIDQGDHEGKKLQIKHMRSIYREAYVTIVASEGEFPANSLPGVSIPRRYHYYGQSFKCDNTDLADLPKSEISIKT